MQGRVWGVVFIFVLEVMFGFWVGFQGLAYGHCERLRGLGLQGFLKGKLGVPLGFLKVLVQEFKRSSVRGGILGLWRLAGRSPLCKKGREKARPMYQGTRFCKPAQLAQDPE